MDAPPLSPATRIACRVLSATNRLLAFIARGLSRGPLPPSPARVCVWRTGNVGDLVCALPALAAVRRTWPGAELTLLTSTGKRGHPGARELLEDAPWIDQLESYYPIELTAMRFARELQERDFDLVVRLPQNMSSPWRELRDLFFLRFMARIRHVRGFAVGSLRWMGRGPARALASGRQLEHETDRLLQLLPEECARAHGVEYPLPLTASLRAEAERLLERHGVGDANLLCVAPGAKRPTNRWPVERFGEIAARWVKQGGRVLVLGPAGDRELGSRICVRAGTGCTNLCGESPLLLSATILKRAQLLLSNDTGAMHLAAAVGTPSVVPFSARDVSGRWFPYFAKSAPEASRPIVHRRSPACSPCWLESCPHDNLCLTEIGVDQIWESAILARGPHSVTSAPAALAG